MRILHVLRAPVGGLFRHVLDLSAAQAARGHHVGLIIDATTSDTLTERRLAAACDHLALGITRVPMHRAPSLTDVGACRAVRAAAIAFGCDILHGHGAKGGAYARIAGRRLFVRGRQVGIFYTPHGGTLNYGPGSLEGRLYHGLERVLDSLTSGIVFESAHAASTFEAVIGPARADKRVVHNGLRPADFAHHKPAADAAEFLFVGELRHLKGVDVLLRAQADVNARRDRPARAVIVGAGPDQAEFQRLAEDLGLAHCVTFPGAMPAADAFALGRMILVPSRKESLPYIVLEAAAAGLPLIATNVGGIPEIVDGTDTTLVTPDDVAALASALEANLNDPAAALARGERLKSNVSGRFTVDRMTDDVLAFYATALAVTHNTAAPKAVAQA